MNICKNEEFLFEFKDRDIYLFSVNVFYWIKGLLLRD